jgi:hypothetical protein
MTSWLEIENFEVSATTPNIISPPLKIEKSSILFAICIDFCGEKLQGLGVVSAEILQFYFGENG